jgi:HSP20 family molecular chaperone IbpA
MDEVEGDLFRKMEEIVRRELREMEADMESMLYDLDSKCLKPLYRLEATDDQLIVTFDLPCVSKDGINISSTEDTLSVEAVMDRPVMLKVGGAVQRRLEFQKYSKKIRLPVKVEPTKAKARFRRGLLVIRFPIAKAGNKLEIE